MRRRLPILSLVAMCALGGCVNSDLEARQWDEIQQMQTTLTDMQTYVGDLERLIDSLRKMTVRQDTAIRLLADFTGAIVPGYRQE